MRMSASRIRSINRSIARVNGIICGASGAPRRVFIESTKHPTSGISPHTTRVVAVPKNPQRLKAIFGIGESVSSEKPGLAVSKQI